MEQTNNVRMFWNKKFFLQNIKLNLEYKRQIMTIFIASYLGGLVTIESVLYKDYNKMNSDKRKCIFTRIQR